MIDVHVPINLPVNVTEGESVTITMTFNNNGDLVSAKGKKVEPKKVFDELVVVNSWVCHCEPWAIDPFCPEHREPAPTEEYP